MNENRVHFDMHKSRKQFLSLLIISLLNFPSTQTVEGFEVVSK